MTHYKLMDFGLGGNMGYIEPHGMYFHCTSSWYLHPSDLQKYIDNNHYPAEEMEGCVLLNKIPALEKSPLFALSSPLLDLNLSPGEVERFRDLVRGVVPIENFGLAGLCALRAYNEKEFSGMDSVPLSTFVSWWEKRGAVAGIVINGKVIWN